MHMVTAGLKFNYNIKTVTREDRDRDIGHVYRISRLSLRTGL